MAAAVAAAADHHVGVHLVLQHDDRPLAVVGRLAEADRFLDVAVHRSGWNILRRGREGGSVARQRRGRLNFSSLQVRRLRTA